MSTKNANVYAVAKPFHSVSKLLGLTSFTITHEKGKFVVSTSAFNIFCILSSTISCVVGCFYFNEFVHAVRERFSNYEISSTIEKSSIVLTVVFVYSLIFINWWSFCSQQLFGKIFNALKEVDDELKTINTVDNFARSRRIVISVLFLATVPMIYYMAASFFMVLLLDDLWKAAVIISMWIYTTAINYTLLQFAFFMWQVKIRYRCINSYVSSLNSTKIHSLLKASDPLKVPAILHDRLVDISQLINRCYGLPVSLVKKV